MDDKQPNSIADERIVELYWQRDETAIAQTEKKYSKLLFHIAWGILHDELDCEECLNDTYLGVWNAIPPARPNAFRAFIAQITRRISINRYNEKSAKSRVPSEFTSSLEELSDMLCSDSTVESEYENAELGRLLNGYLSALNERERYLFIGRFYMAQTLSSLASELGVGTTTVHRLIGDIKRGLKEYLERNGVNL